MTTTEGSSVGPIFQVQAGYQTEVPQIAGDEYGPVRQGDGGNQQIGPTDLLEFLVLSQTIELGGGCRIDHDDGERFQSLASLRQPLLGASEVVRHRRP